MTIKAKFTTALATGAVLCSGFVPAAFAQEITVSGNGAYSDNTAKVATQNNTDVSQSNTAKVTNTVDANASTGGNNASFNTGGSTTIYTGDAKTNVAISNNLNSNKALVTPSCSSCSNATNVAIKDNGAYSDTTAKVTDASNVSVSQDNSAKVNNTVNTNATSGKNNAGFNTGGDTTIYTGNAATNVALQTNANKNQAFVGGGNGSSNDSSVSISGNGAFSNNLAKLNNSADVSLYQDNYAKINNYVNALANTGKNDANFNTGGGTTIYTGDAYTGVTVLNKLNSNFASIESFLPGALAVKIAGNGAFSDNKVKVKDENNLSLYQDNFAKLYNDIFSHANTGKNDLSFSTAAYGEDPTIATGYSSSGTTVDNNANKNLFSQGDFGHMLLDMFPYLQAVLG